jgi:peptidoglycan/xylan/chitin deacetylase (PgdA/CDA1 family)
MRPPSDHWVALALLLTFLAVTLGLTGFASHELGRSSTVAGATPVGGLDDAGPLLDLSGEEIRSVQPADHEVALTFDDGPDPRWTPAILDVLARRRVPATFFVVGASVLEHPGLVRREVDAGHDVGSHTFTHADLSSTPGGRESLELSLTETALEGATGRSTSILPFPYSSTTAALTAGQLRAAQQAAHDGYLLVTSTHDGEDWQRAGAPAIVASAMPSDGRGAIILLHDGGGDRSQTVAALDQLIDRLEAAGYQFRFDSLEAALRAVVRA